MFNSCNHNEISTPSEYGKVLYCWLLKFQKRGPLLVRSINAKIKLAHLHYFLFTDLIFC